MELLAPAGNLECGIAAFTYGADAVYLGMQQFSARADAGNFTPEDLAVLLGFAHQRPTPGKVYVTINTLARQNELPALLEMLAQLRELGVDALIIQDLGTYHLAQKHCPELPLHASTQLAVHNRAGVVQAAKMGFRRVIAARELTLEELSAMATVPDIELEAFVHGALCYGYSGLCLLSSCLRNSSGNRGECSYICRNSFRITEKGRPLADNCAIMSMKDLALPDLLPQLRKTGLASLKIEGRKKSPLYVAAVTNYYRKLLDKTFAAGERDECERHLKSIFSRPWSKLFLQTPNAAGVTDCQTVGHRGTAVGTVQAVIPGLPDKLRFLLQNQTLEKHDGLQLELPEREKPYGFAVEEIRVFPQGNSEDSRLTFMAEPNQVIEVPLPDSHPTLTPGQAIYCSSSQAAKRAYRWPSVRPALTRSRHQLFFLLQIRPQELTVTSQLNTATRELPQCRCTLPLSEALSVARKPEQLAETARQCFAKLGDTHFMLADLRLDNPEGLFVPTATLNELRRLAVAAVSELLTQECQNTVREAGRQLQLWQPETMPASPEKPSWTVKIDQPFFLNLFTDQDWQRLQEVILDLSRIPEEALPEALAALEQKAGRNRLCLALPAITRPLQNRDWPALVRKLFAAGWRRWQISNLGSIEMLAQAGATPGNAWISADWPLYVCNHAAARACLELGLQRLTLSPDDTLENWSSLLAKLPARLQIPAYSDLPLAISATCANASRLGLCPGKKNCNFTEMTLLSRKNERLLAINNNCQSVYINEQPFNLSGKLAQLQQLGAQSFRADFIWRNYAPAQVKQIWCDLQEDRQNHTAWTANLFTHL
ncbi:MAG: U32 family peptidase [Oligosphaeraceae bacterium]|nr:U32 family peptidase [Oligosphaeraceae bacterium]